MADMDIGTALVGLAIIGFIVWAIGSVIVRAINFIVTLVTSRSSRTNHSETTSQKASSAELKGFLTEVIRLKLRLQDVEIKAESKSIPAKEIQIHGYFPLKETKNTAAWISILDESTGIVEPVLCAIDSFHEAGSPAYFAQCEFGVVAPFDSISEWARIGVIFPEILQPPRGGQRELTIVVRLVDVSAPPVVELGFLKSDQSEILWQQKIKFTHHFKEKGYLEAAEHRQEAQILTLKIAMAVAISDGSLHEQEGLLMQKWIRQSIAPFSGQKETDIKDTFNQVLQESYTEAKRGSLDLETLAIRLNDIGETGNKYHALELSADIMAADGIAHADEIKALNNLAKLLDLDMKRVTEILDTRLIKLDPTITGGASAEDRVGIEAGWSDERIKKHLRDAFSKWNNRLNTLPEGKERNNAQRMLDDIAKVRKKYAG